MLTRNGPAAHTRLVGGAHGGKAVSQSDYSREPESDELTITFTREEVEALVGGVEYVNVTPARRSAYDKLRSVLEPSPGRSGGTAAPSDAAP